MKTINGRSNDKFSTFKSVLRPKQTKQSLKSQTIVVSYKNPFFFLRNPEFFRTDTPNCNHITHPNYTIGRSTIKDHLNLFPLIFYPYYSANVLVSNPILQSLTTTHPNILIPDALILRHSAQYSIPYNTTGLNKTTYINCTVELTTQNRQTTNH